MAGVVVDASVAAAWFLPDEATPFTEAALEVSATAEVWVPAMCLLEIGNLFISAQRRKRMTAAQRRSMPLATLDAALLKAMASAGVAPFEPA